MTKKQLTKSIDDYLHFCLERCFDEHGEIRQDRLITYENKVRKYKKTGWDVEEYQHQLEIIKSRDVYRK